MKITKKQSQAIFIKWSQDNQNMTYLQFRRTCFPEFIGIGEPAIMVKWCGMLLGIESDGYTHS